MGVVKDSKLTLYEHIKRAADKAATITAALCRMMANIGGPKRYLLMSVTQSVMLYGTET